MQGTINKILIRTPNWLGDLVMSTVFIQAVMHKYPKAEVDLVVKSNLVGLPVPNRGTIYPLNNRWGNRQFFQKILQKKYQIVYVLPPSFSAALMAFKTRIPTRIGFYSRSRSWLLNQTVVCNQPRRSQHLADEYLQLLGMPWKKEKFGLNLTFTEPWIQQQSNFQSTTPYVVIAPGAKYGPAKRWPPSFYRQVINFLLAKSWSVCLVGTQEDQPAISKIYSKHPKLFNLCGQTSLAQLMALLHNSDLLISNDSGLMHLMAALGKPQICLFGSSSPQWTAPLNKNAVILQHPVPCAPCFQKTCRFGHYNCLKQILPEQVMQAIEDLLNQPRTLLNKD